MKKKYLGILLILLLGISLVACGSDDTDLEDPIEEEQEVESEEEMESIKDKTIEADFIEINAGKVEEGTMVHLIANIDLVIGEEGIFNEILISTKENDGYGMYTLKQLSSEDFEYNEDEMVEVWGMYEGKGKDGIPIILGVVVENINAEPAEEKDGIEHKEESKKEIDMTSLENLYKKVNDEYENQKDNFNPISWSEFGRNFKDESDKLDILDKNQENMDYNLTLGYIKQLHLEYNKTLQGKDGDPEYFKNEIEELLK